MTKDEQEYVKLLEGRILTLDERLQVHGERSKTLMQDIDALYECETARLRSECRHFELEVERVERERKAWLESLSESSRRILERRSGEKEDEAYDARVVMAMLVQMMGDGCGSQVTSWELNCRGYRNKGMSWLPPVVDEIWNLESKKIKKN